MIGEPPKALGGSNIACLLPVPTPGERLFP